MQIVVDGLLTNYQQQGERGPVALLVHGWGDSLQTYDGLSDVLATKYRITRLDLPGFGQTQPPKTVWGLDNYAQFLTHFVNKLGLKPDVLIGHSNGGAVAIKAVSNQQVIPKWLVLIGGAGVRNRQGLRRLILKLIAKTGKLLTFWLPSSSRRRLQRKFYGAVGSDYLVAPHLKETFKRTVAEDIVEDAQRTTIPTLLIYGEQDTATPIKQVGLVLHEAIANSKLNIIHGANHFVHQQKSAEVAAMIQEFTKS